MLLVLFCCVWSLSSAVHCCEDVTGQVVAFADVNYDRLTDVITISTPRKEINIYLAVPDSNCFANKTSSFGNLSISSVSVPQDYIIVNVYPADFNNDEMIDLAFIVAERNNPRNFTVVVFWGGKHDIFKADGNNTLSFIQEPMVVDCHFNQIPGFFGQLDSSKQRLCFFWDSDLQKFRSVAMMQCNSSGTVLTRNSAFVDVTGDLSPDVVFLREASDSSDSTGSELEVWTWDFFVRQWTLLPAFMTMPKHKPRHELFTVYDPEKDNPRLGPSAFVDFDGDGFVDQVIPVCHDASCRNVSFYVWSAGEKIRNPTKSSEPYIVPISLQSDKWTQWGLYSPQEVGYGGFIVRQGDYTLDGYPDILVVLQNRSDVDSAAQNSKIVALLENVPCTGECGGWSRTFRAQWNLLINPADTITSETVNAAFFDLQEDGILDVMVETVKKVNFVATGSANDAYFLKVETYTSTCSTNCFADSEPANSPLRDFVSVVGSAIPYVGATVTYEGTDSEGHWMRGAATQMSQFTHRSLQLPYITFGLGRTPNFIEWMKVGISNKNYANHTWSQIVPNSRIYVIPYPAGEPQAWISRLYVTPSRLLALSAVAVSSICVAIILAIIILHCYEKRSDKLERLQDQHRFHFDAM